MDLDGACDANRFASQPLDAGTKRQIVTFNALCKDFTCQVLLLRHFSGIGQYNKKRVGDMSVGDDSASGNFISSEYMGIKIKGPQPLYLYFSRLPASSTTFSPSSLVKAPFCASGRISRTTSEGRHSLVPNGVTTIGRLIRMGYCNIKSMS